MTKPRYLCQNFPKKLLNENKFNAHVKVHAIETALKCNLCNQEFISHSKLNVHINCQHQGFRYTQKRSLKCSLCGFDICSESQLVDHMRTHTGERPFNCTASSCGKTFKLESAMKSHIKHKHNDTRPFECEFQGCKYAAKTYGTLTQHKKVHRDDRPFACPTAGCNYRAKLKQHLTKHVASVHKQSKPFACSQCDYKAARSDTLQQHMRHCHSTTRDFKCSHPHCSQSFKSLGNLKIHFSNRHEERNIHCNHQDCGRKFTSAEALNLHKVTSHSKKSISCPHRNCKFQTNTARKLARHAIVHDGRNDNKSCLIKDCQYKGRNNIALRAHMHRHENLVACPVSGCGLFMRACKKQALKDHARLHNPLDRPFQCPLCLRHYQTLTKRKMYSFSHTKEKPYKCGHCEFAASYRINVKTHISSFHANIKFPVRVHLPSNYHECLACAMILPLAEFVVHAMDHEAPVVVIERVETKWL